jgi:hypothetical protein
MRTSPPNCELMADEDRLCSCRELLDVLPPEGGRAARVLRRGLVRELPPYIGSRLADAGVMLERIRFGTYRPGEIDADAVNDEFLGAMKGVPCATVRSRARGARSRRLNAWVSRQGQGPATDRLIRNAGPDHHVEHLPRLRDWLADLRG